MREVGAFEAKNTLGSLLDLVQQGEQVIITRHGRPVARLVPESAVRDAKVAKAAVERVRSRALARRDKGIKPEEWKRFRDEGRV